MHHGDLCTEIDAVGSHLIANLGNSNLCEKFMLNTEPRARALLAAYPECCDPEYSLAFDDQRDLTAVQAKALTIFDEMVIAFSYELLEEIITGEAVDGRQHMETPDFMVRVKRLQCASMSKVPTYVLVLAYTWLLRLVLERRARQHG